MVRVELEKRFDALSENYDQATGIAALKLSKQLELAERCLDWQGANPKELDIAELTEVIREPTGEDVVEDTYRAKIKNQRTAIRAYCVVCMGGSVVDVKECSSVSCQLFPFRMGRDPIRGYLLPKPENDPPILDDELIDESLDDDESDDDDEKDDSCED